MSEFRVVANTNEVAPNSIKAVDLDGNEIAIANVDGTYLAFGTRCGCISTFVGHHDEEGVDGHFHVGNRGFLPEGTLDGTTIQCPVHKTIYDMRTGEALSSPGETPDKHLRSTHRRQPNQRRSIVRYSTPFLA